MQSLNNNKGRPFFKFISFSVVFVNHIKHYSVESDTLLAASTGGRLRCKTGNQSFSAGRSFWSPDPWLEDGFEAPAVHPVEQRASDREALRVSPYPPGGADHGLRHHQGADQRQGRGVQAAQVGHRPPGARGDGREDAEGRGRTGKESRETGADVRQRGQGRREGRLPTAQKQGQTVRACGTVDF